MKNLIHYSDRIMSSVYKQDRAKSVHNVRCLKSHLENLLFVILYGAIQVLHRKKEYLKLLYLKFINVLKFRAELKFSKISLNLSRSITEFQNLRITFF